MSKIYKHLTTQERALVITMRTADEQPVHDVFDELHQHFVPYARQELVGHDVAG